MGRRWELPSQQPAPRCFPAASRGESLSLVCSRTGSSKHWCCTSAFFLLTFAFLGQLFCQSTAERKEAAPKNNRAVLPAVTHHSTRRQQPWQEAAACPSASHVQFVSLGHGAGRFLPHDLLLFLKTQIRTYIDIDTEVKRTAFPHPDGSDVANHS